MSQLHNAPYASSENRWRPGVVTTMGRGSDLTAEERASLHSKLKERWGYDRKRVRDAGVIVAA